MSQTQDTSFDGHATEVDDLDVEGHGMREVALGLGAATIVASGAGAALAMNPTSGTSGTTTGVSGVVAAAQAAAGGVASDAMTLTGAASETAVDTAQHGITALDPIGQQAQLLLADADATTQAATQRAEQIAADPFEEVDRLHDQVVKDVRALRDGALTTAGTTIVEAQAAAHSAVTTLGTTADQAVTTAGGAADEAVVLANDAATFATETAFGVIGEDIGVKADHSDGKTSASVTAAGHTVEVSAG